MKLSDVERILADKDPTSFSVEVVKELGLSTEALRKAVEDEEERVSSEAVAGAIPSSPAAGPPPGESIERPTPVTSRHSPDEAESKGVVSAAPQQLQSASTETKREKPEPNPAQAGTKMSRRDNRSEATMWRVLHGVGVGGLRRRNEIAKECGLSERTTSRQLGKLVEMDLLVSSKRKYLLTEKGKEVVETIKRELQTEREPEKNNRSQQSS